ncbi:MAG TPA: universal stress protein [Stellaceae bacterium]|nr:universal stress protein [Stellaceae bacterium]
MPNIVLVILGRAEAAEACLDAAAHAARALGDARVIAVATRTPIESQVLPSEEVLTSRRRAELQQRADAAIAGLKARFDAWQRERGLPASWTEAAGAAADEIHRHGQAVELLVVAAAPGAHDGTALRTALLDTQRPVILVPDRIGPSLGRRVAIAWHEDEPAVRAVLAAMPFLVAAERIWVLQASRAGQAMGRLPAILEEHGIAAELRGVPAGHDAGAALLAEAHALAADLLVMGAYAHSPLVEAVLGGVTRTVLRRADLPVLLRH